MADARGASLEVIVTEQGGPSIPISDNSALDTDPTIGRINVNSGLLNLSPADFQFTGLHAGSNSPGEPDPTGALLTVGGEVMTAGASSITVLVTDTDYS